MKSAIAITVMMSFLAQAEAEKPGDSDQKKSPARPNSGELAKQRADDAIKLAQEQAGRYSMYRSDDREAEFKLRPTAVHRWTNPITQDNRAASAEMYGGVFVWTDRGCPVVLASIHTSYSRSPPFVVHELVSLVDDRVVAERAGIRQWNPNRAGIERQTVRDAPDPAKLPPIRLAQMRAICREFSANKTNGNNVTAELRLLSNPLFRYDSSDPTVVDGALFAFADGTDPEVLLLLEARRTAGVDQWYFAAARLNQLHVQLFHDQQKVWEAPYLTRAEWRNRQEPYLLQRQPEPEVNTP